MEVKYNASKTVAYFNGVEYKLRNTHSKSRTKSSPRFVGSHQRTKPSHLYLHREVYKYFKGPISDDCDVHHLDGDRFNNDVSNLVALPHSKHLSVTHMGRVNSESHRKKISVWLNKHHPMKGKHLSLETRQKISKAMCRYQKSTNYS
jgi:hypothetical protein